MLKLNDFKKAGWDCSKFFAVKTIKDDQKYIKFAMMANFDDNEEIDTFFIGVAGSIINNINIQLDNISTIEELENTANDLYNAVITLS